MPSREPRDYIPDSFVPFRLATICDKSEIRKRRTRIGALLLDHEMPLPAEEDSSAAVIPVKAGNQPSA